MIPEHVVDWAGLPGPSVVLDEVRRRREAGRLGVRSRLELALTSSERTQVGRMLDSSWAVSSEPVVISRLAAGLRAHGVELDDLLERMGGPIRNLRAERAVARGMAATDREAGIERLGALLGRRSDDIDRVLARCLASADSWLARAVEVDRVLAAVGGRQVRLGVLAVELYGDAHALDRNLGLGRAVARFLALRSGVARSEVQLDPAVSLLDSGLGWIDPLSDSGLWHDAWASAGVICDRVSAQVLVLNLPLVGDTPAVGLCEATPGEPVWLSLRSLDGSFALADGVTEVFVCENPAIVEAAADMFRDAGRPLVCTFGIPTLATFRLLDGLDARLRVRADGDPTGWSIVSQLRNRYPTAELWRMPEGCSSYEEQLLDDLLADLNPLR